jgi:hypothetical protein
MPSEENNYFTTRDIHLATALMTLKYPLECVDYSYEGEKDKPVAFFNFKYSDDIRKTEREYWQGLLAVEPRNFMSNYRYMRAYIANEINNPNNKNMEWDKAKFINKNE